MKGKDILIKNVDVELLKKQKLDLITVSELVDPESELRNSIDGILNLLDHIQDQAESITWSIGQNLFDALQNVAGFTALESDMQEIVLAVKKDQEQNER